MGRCGDNGGHIPAEGDGLTGSDLEVGCGGLRWYRIELLEAIRWLLVSSIIT